MATIYTSDDLIRGYLADLESDFEAAPSDEGFLVTTPFDRPDGGSIEIEMRVESDGSVHLSDMGDTLGYLHVNGLTLTKSIATRAKDICNQRGVAIAKSELVVISDVPAGFGKALHRLIQSIISVTDLIQQSRPSKRSPFHDDVEALIIASGVSYDREFAVRGQQGRYSVKFHIDDNHNLLIHPLTASSETVALAVAERWARRIYDIRERDPKWDFVAVLDDRDPRKEFWTRRAWAPLRENSILWDNRQRLSDMLAGCARV